MEVSATQSSMAMEIASAKMEKKQIKDEGDAALKLLESARQVEQTRPSEPGKGVNLDEFA